MAFNRRSQATASIAAMLSDTPFTVRDFSLALGISIPTVQNSVATLLNSGEARECTVMGQFGKPARGFLKPQSKVERIFERGEYTGEPRPLRYVPREEPYISLGQIGD